VFLLVGGLGAGYAFSRSHHRQVSGPTPAAAAPNPPPVAPAPPQPASPTGQAAAAPATTPTQVSVPRLIGDSLPRAIAALRQAGLTATVRHVDSLKPEGSVVGQNPEAGTKSAKGSSVRLDVSLQPLVAVPDVTGMRGVTAVK